MDSVYTFPVFKHTCTLHCNRLPSNSFVCAFCHHFSGAQIIISGFALFYDSSEVVPHMLL